VFQHDHVRRFAGAGCHFATFDGLCPALLNTKSRFNRHSDITLHVYETPATRKSGISADGFPQRECDDAAHLGAPRQATLK
jgi:hypothetical protein